MPRIGVMHCLVPATHRFLIVLLCVITSVTHGQDTVSRSNKGMVFATRVWFANSNYSLDGGVGFRWKRHTISIGAGYFIGEADGPIPQTRFIRYEFDLQADWKRFSFYAFVEYQDYSQSHSFTYVWIAGAGVRFRLFDHLYLEEGSGFGFYHSWPRTGPRSPFQGPWNASFQTVSFGLRYELDFNSGASKNVKR